MSNTIEAFAGFSIHQDGAENIAARKTKRDDIHGKPPATKRAALGTITNACNTRVQPQRAAKQGILTDNLTGTQDQENLYLSKTQENAFSKQDKTHSSSVFSIGTSQPFNLHVDQPVVSNVQSSVGLHPAVRQPLSVVSSRTEHLSIDHHSNSSDDSPMLLDESLYARPSEPTEDSESSRLKKVLTVPEYSDDIYSYLREAELRNRPKPGYMKKQPDITNSMRSILVDWLVEVAEEYKLHRETLCLSVNYIDRFLSQMSVVRGKLQLVGAASMFLAAKYEEIYPPEVGEFVFITDDTYTKKQVLRMEHLVLKVLSFDVAIPTFNCFGEKFLKDRDADDTLSSLAMYLGELTMMEAEPYLGYLPSVIAASAVCLAAITLDQEAWPDVMVKTTGYRLSDLQDCMQHMYNSFMKAPQSAQQAIREKYKQDKYHQVSMLSPPPMLTPVMQQSPVM